MAIDFRIRDFLYPAGLCRLRRTFERTQWLADGELRAYQEQRLALVVGHAYARIPYYRRLFQKLGLSPSDIGGINDLKKLPTLSKDGVREAGADLVAEDARRYHPVLYRTSGTSGMPVRIHLDRSANILEFVYYWRHWNWAGYRLGDRFAELGSLFFLNREHLSEAAFSWQPHLRRLMLNSGRLAVRYVDEMAGAIRKCRPRFLKGTASSVYFLALCMKEAGITDISFKAVFSTGEGLTPQYRQLLRTVFDCPVLDSYGHMERTVAISQCMHGGYHVNSDYGLLEFDDLRPLNGEKMVLGRAIGTSLYNMAMPLIRYEVGDDIEIFAETRNCPCGRTLPLVKAVHGRGEDTIVTPDGLYVTSMFIVPELTDGARLVQFIQESESRLHVNIVPGPEWEDPKKQKLAHYVRKLVGATMDLSFDCVTMDDIVTDPSGKIRTVISRIKSCP